MNNLEKILVAEKSKKPTKAKKSIKRIVSDFMAILTVISIFVFSISSLIFIIFVFVSSYASAAVEKSSAEKFQETIQYVNSFKDVVQTEKTKEGNLNLKVNSFKLEPEKVFSDPKTQKNWYTATPTQSNYYGDTIQSNVNGMGKDARTEITKDETYKDTDGKPILSPGKAITEDFRTRPVFKISKNEEYIKKSRLVEANARNVVSGESNKHIDCKNKKLSTCKIIQVQKTCNEEVRTIQKICEKVPKITTYIRDAAYPDCRIIDIKQGAGARCLGGYGEILYADMIEGPADDDVHICAKAVNEREGSECLGGYLVSGKWNNIQGPGRATVPKKRHSRIRFSNIYGHGRYLPVTIVNETTGQVLHNDVRFYNGQVVDLPFSEDRDQVFRFYKSGSASWRDIGVVILYIDHIYKEKIANVTWPDAAPESFCYEK